MSEYRRAIAVSLCALSLASICGTVAAGAMPRERGRTSTASHGAQTAFAKAQPALWRTYDMLVNFHDLPRTYTCDQLWYEFDGILLSIGAPHVSISILPYDCSPSPSGDLKSPNVQARFVLPFVLQPGVKGAPFEAVDRTIRLSPGKPKTLHAADCQLFQQIDQTLLAALPVKTHDAHFDCSAPPPRSGDFGVTVTLPVDTAVAATIGTSPASAGPGRH